MKRNSRFIFSAIIAILCIVALLATGVFMAKALERTQDVNESDTFYVKDFSIIEIDVEKEKDKVIKYDVNDMLGVDHDTSSGEIVWDGLKQTVNNNESDSLVDKINELDELKQLSNREKDVFRLTIEGKKRKEIATLLFYSENTVKKDLSSIYKKLEVNDKSELMIKYKYLL